MNSVWVDQASSIALLAHHDQKDKGGDPYVWHPFAVANKVRDLGEMYCIVALLHDVIEDTPVTLGQIGAALGAYPGIEKVLSALDAITRRDDELYFNYIERVSKNRIATAVKLADIEHNLDESRNWEVPASLRKRYEKAVGILEGGI